MNRTSRIKLYGALIGAFLLFASIVAVVFTIEDRKDKDLAAQLEKAESDLLGLGAEIAGIKDADVETTNDFIAAYAQVEPLEKEYDAKLQQFSELYQRARERDSHRVIFDPQRFRGRHHPETWDKMSEIISLVRQINEITKREISVVHAMTSLPEPERLRFWHEQFMPLAAQEHALREQLQIAGQGAAKREESIH